MLLYKSYSIKGEKRLNNRIRIKSEEYIKFLDKTKNSFISCYCQEITSHEFPEQVFKKSVSGVKALKTIEEERGRGETSFLSIKDMDR
jgi:hypothetical protein